MRPTLRLCIDCTMYLANGEVESPADGWDGLDSSWDGRRLTPLQRDGDLIVSFGSSPCDGCGTGLGGDRIAHREMYWPKGAR